MLRGWLFVMVAAGALSAQPAFDVASVKQGGPVRPDGLLDINLGGANHGTVTLSNTTLSECLQYAYSLHGEEQIAGPEWIRDRSFRFEIEAKAQPDTPDDQLKLMLQRLLQERFRLELHREPRKVEHLEITVAKDGPKMPRFHGGGPTVRREYGRGRLDYSGLTMAGFAMILARQLKRPVVDNTGLPGRYDFDLTYTPEDTPPDADLTAHPDVFTAIQQQLGLKLEDSKAPMEVLVVDHAEKVPIGN